MTQRLPPVLLLQTIEAVARLGSVKRAADEMSVTPSAISHRVRLVEEHFGRRLFEREGQGIRATDQAHKLAAAVAKAVGGLEAEWRTLTDTPGARRVRVCAMAAFAEQFIISEHSEFRRKFPDFELDSTNQSLGEGGMRGDYDILIGIGPYPDEAWEYEDLLPLRVKALYSPATGTAVVDGNVLRGPILTSSGNFLPWKEAAEQLGFTIAPDAQQVQFDSLLTACSAAARGKGITLAPEWMADRMVREDGLVTFDDRAVTSPLTYWLAVRKTRKLDTTFERFRRWLEGAIA